MSYPCERRIELTRDEQHDRHRESEESKHRRQKDRSRKGEDPAETTDGQQRECGAVWMTYIAMKTGIALKNPKNNRNVCQRFTCKPREWDAENKTYEYHWASRGKLSDTSSDRSNVVVLDSFGKTEFTTLSTLNRLGNKSTHASAVPLTRLILSSSSTLSPSLISFTVSATSLGMTWLRSSSS